MSVAIVIVLCAISAIAGRLLLSRQVAKRTLGVRLPALAMLLICGSIYVVATIVGAILCFVAGSYYGLTRWWVEWALNLWFESFPELLGPIVTGAWE